MKIICKIKAFYAEIYNTKNGELLWDEVPIYDIPAYEYNSDFKVEWEMGIYTMNDGTSDEGEKLKSRRFEKLVDKNGVRNITFHGVTFSFFESSNEIYINQNFIDI